MSANSKIEWTDHTFNPWIGCTKVSPGCLHCYAERDDRRRKWTPGGWGKGKARKRTSAANWREPVQWNKAAEAEALDLDERRRISDPKNENKELWKARRPRVFCASLADWLDDEVPAEWIADLLTMIHRTPLLDWLLLTKRPQLFRERLLAARATFRIDHEDMTDRIDAWLSGSRPPWNVWLGTSVEDQVRADERIPHLLRIPARVRFLSCEPLLGPVDLRAAVRPCEACPRCTPPTDPGCPYCLGTGGVPVFHGGAIHWVIAGGESGPGARPIHPAWVRDLRSQCDDAGVAFFFKQWGEWAPATFGQAAFEKQRVTGVLYDSGVFTTNALDSIGQCFIRTGKATAGRLLDGREYNGWPA